MVGPTNFNVQSYYCTNSIFIQEKKKMKGKRKHHKGMFNFVFMCAVRQHTLYYCSVLQGYKHKYLSNFMNLIITKKNNSILLVEIQKVFSYIVQNQKNLVTLMNTSFGFHFMNLITKKQKKTKKNNTILHVKIHIMFSCCKKKSKKKSGYTCLFSFALML